MSVGARLYFSAERIWPLDEKNFDYAGASHQDVRQCTFALIAY
ncbi:MAG: hypothetical protein ACI9FD_004616, partial [Gammaproteobacteria bacterium]